MKNPVARFFVATVATLFFAIVLDAAELAAPLATVTKVKGAPTVTKAGSTASVELTAGLDINEGDLVKTDGNSKATLLFSDGEIRVITSGSAVCFKASEKPAELSKIASVTGVVADAVSMANVEKAFAESVTGAKMAIGGRPSEKEMSGGAPAPNDESRQMEVQGHTDYASKSSQLREADVPSPAPPPIAMPAPAPSASLAVNKPDVKNWGNWYDGQHSIAWNKIVPGALEVSEISKDEKPRGQKFSAKAAERARARRKGEAPGFLISLKKEGAAAVSSFRVGFSYNEKSLESVKRELKQIEALEREDAETYFYIKAGILKKYSYYIAALSALDQLETLPGVKADAPHVVKLRTIIYKAMGEYEKALSEVKKLEGR